MTAPLPLNCTTRDNGIVEGVHDVRTQCISSSVPITGKVESRDDTPPFAIQDPYPTTGGCTVDSIVTPYFTAGDAQLNITLGDDSQKKAEADSRPAEMTFALYTLDFYLTFPSREIDVSETPGGLGSQVWHNCTNFPGYRLPHCDFRYDYATDKIEVHQEWLCFDKGNSQT